VIALVTEYVGTERRSTAIGFLYASLPCGGALASVIATLTSAEDQWRIVYLVGGIAPLVLVPLLALVLENRGPVTSSTKRTPTSGVVGALFGERRAFRTLVLWASFFLALLTMYLLLGWLPSFMGSRGLTRPQASMVQIAFNACGALGSILTGFILDTGKRSVAVVLVFAGALACVGFLIGVPAAFALAVLAGGLVGATVSGTQTILYDLAPACYPSEVRGTGVGFAVAAGRLGSAVGPILAGALIGLGFAPAQILLCLMPILALSGLGALVLVATTHQSALRLT
jgi:AAHS family 3-hydroxyphenylpropionic acid transporter